MGVIRVVTKAKPAYKLAPAFRTFRMPERINFYTADIPQGTFGFCEDAPECFTLNAGDILVETNKPGVWAVILDDEDTSPHQAHNNPDDYMVITIPEAGINSLINLLDYY